MLIYLAMLETEQDKALFAELYTKYYSEMLSVALGILKETHLAEDAVHEAFLRIAEKFEKYFPKSGHKPGGLSYLSGRWELMPNKENLVPNEKRTPSERRKIAQKAGKASGKARRERKQLKKELLLLLEQGDTQEKICLALIQQARRGNIKAFKVVRDTIGEKPVDMMSVDMAPDTAAVIAEIEEYVRGKSATGSKDTTGE